MSKQWAIKVAGVAVTALTACAAQPVQYDGGFNLPVVDNLPIIDNRPNDCRQLLSQSLVESEQLDSGNIRVLNWNIQKESNLGWYQDLSFFANNRDLVLIQEAMLQQPFLGSVSSDYGVFAKGFSNGVQKTGVATFSSAKPLMHCTFTDIEPILRTPKATSITEFALSESDETLVVVNIHAVNFSLGLRAFRQQISRVADVLAGHVGPIIFSGDFNTWRNDRNDIVSEVTQKLGMKALTFETDQRTQVFGLHLDHMYIRGLSSVESFTRQVGTSDHNPMFAVLKI